MDCSNYLYFYDFVLTLSCSFSGGLPTVEVPSPYDPRQEYTESFNGTGQIANVKPAGGYSCFHVDARPTALPTISPTVSSAPTSNEISMYTFSGDGECQDAYFHNYSKVAVVIAEPAARHLNKVVEWCSQNKDVPNFVGFNYIYVGA